MKLLQKVRHHVFKHSVFIELFADVACLEYIDLHNQVPQVQLDD